jgi:hypothetical protein
LKNHWPNNESTLFGENNLWCHTSFRWKKMMQRLFFLCSLIVLTLFLAVGPLWSDTSTMELVEGFNFVTPTLQPDTITSTTALFAQNSKVTDIFRFDSLTQEFKFQLRLENSSLFGEAFSFEAGEGYIVKMSSPDSINWTGTQTTKTASATLRTGFNCNGFSFPVTISATSLLENNSQLASIFRWDSTNQQFKFLLKLDNGSLFGEDFNLSNGIAYFFKASSDFVLTPLTTSTTTTITSNAMVMTLPTGIDGSLVSISESDLISQQKSGVGPAFQVTGLEESLTATAEIEIVISDWNTVNDTYFIVREEVVFVPSLQKLQTQSVILATTRQGQTLKASIAPSASLSAPTSYMPSRAAGTYVHTFWVVSNYLSLRSDDGHFEVTFPAQFSSIVEQEVIPALKSYYALIEGLGFDWSKRTSWPLAVNIQPLSSSNNTVYGAAITSMLGINNYSLQLNSNLLTTDKINDMKLTAAHELFHLAQFLYDPRNVILRAKTAGEWLWLDEASAVWFEVYAHRKSSSAIYVPNVAVTNFDFVKDASLDGSAMDVTLAGGHGYGASMFIASLEKNSSPLTIGNLMKSKESNITPLAALMGVTNLATTWVNFCREYADQIVFGVGSEFPSASSLNSLRVWTQDFVWKGTREVEKKWDTVPDLTAKFFVISLSDNNSIYYKDPTTGDVSMTRPWPGNTSVTIRLDKTGIGDGSGKIYRYTNSNFEVVADIDGEYTLTNILENAEADPLGYLYYLVSFANDQFSTPVSTSKISCNVKLHTLVVDRLEPATGMIGDTAKIYGDGFGDTQGASELRLATHTIAEIVSWSNTMIEFKVPSTSYSLSSKFSVGIWHANGFHSNTKDFQIIY